MLQLLTTPICPNASASAASSTTSPASTTSTHSSTRALAMNTWAHISRLLHHNNHARTDSGFQSHPPSPLHGLNGKRSEDVADNAADVAEDAECADANERRARVAVRHAIRNSSELHHHLPSLTDLAILGYGSNGVVCAISPNACVKIIYKSSSSTTSATGIPNEILILEALSRDGGSHPNIVRHIAHWSDAKYWYLVTSLHGTPSSPATSTFTFLDKNQREVTIPVSAGSSDLWSWNLAMLNRQSDPSTLWNGLNPAPLPTVRHIFHGLASALAHCHSRNIAHGDIKEENCIVDANGDAVLCDFGHAELFPDSTLAANRIAKYGTREMTPPELLPNLVRGSSSRSTAVTADAFSADVYALGLVLFAMLHGPGCLPAAVRDSINTGHVTPDGEEGLYPLGLVRPDIDPRALEVMRGCTLVDPRERWTIADVLACDWLQE